MTNERMILALAGMSLRSGFYPPEWWECKTGVSPRLVPQIRINRHGMCEWTKEAESAYQRIMQEWTANWMSLEVSK